MSRRVWLAGLILLVCLPACRAKAPPLPKSRSGQQLYKPLPTPVPPKPAPGQPTPRRPLPD